jgi:hypothetical protein
MKRILLTLLAMSGSWLFAQNCSDLFFSEYNEGSSQNKAVEIYNPTNSPVDLSNYKVRRYKNGQATWDTEFLLSGTLAPYDVVIITNGQLVPNSFGAVDSALYNLGDLHCNGDYNTSPFYFNGNDALTIEKLNGTIIDIFARIGPPDPENGWTNISDTTISYNSGGTPTNYTISNYMAGPLFWLAWTANHTLIRKPSVKKGVTVNPLPFMVQVEWDSLPQNFWDSLGFHTCECAPSTAIPTQELRHDVIIFPNPATSPEILIKGTGSITRVEVSNILGQQVINSQNQGLPGEMRIDISALDEGIYIVKVDFANRSSVQKKIIVKR